MTGSDPRHDLIAGWVSDFPETPRYAELSAAAREYSQVVLTTLLEEACRGTREASIDMAPGDVEKDDLKRAFFRVARMDLPASVHQEVPALCRAFLAVLEEQGRLAGGIRLGQFLHALGPSYRDATSEKPRPIVSPTTRLGRNDPCPCGSGKKYKKCCMNLLG